MAAFPWVFWCLGTCLLTINIYCRTSSLCQSNTGQEKPFPLLPRESFSVSSLAPWKGVHVLNPRSKETVSSENHSAALGHFLRQVKHQEGSLGLLTGLGPFPALLPPVTPAARWWTPGMGKAFWLSGWQPCWRVSPTVFLKFYLRNQDLLFPSISRLQGWFLEQPPPRKRTNQITKGTVFCLKQTLWGFVAIPLASVVRGWMQSCPHSWVSLSTSIPRLQVPASAWSGHTGRVFHSGQLPRACSQRDSPRTTQRQVKSLIFHPLPISRADM